MGLVNSGEFLLHGQENSNAQKTPLFTAGFTEVDEMASVQATRLAASSPDAWPSCWPGAEESEPLLWVSSAHCGSPW